MLCDVAREHGCKNIVFSSSATVYGEPEFVPITEDCPKHNATNPYGQTKSMLEQILTDLYIGDDEYVHASASAGYVTVGSLNPASVLWRPDLAQSFLCFAESNFL